MPTACPVHAASHGHAAKARARSSQGQGTHACSSQGLGMLAWARWQAPWGRQQGHSMHAYALTRTLLRRSRSVGGAALRGDPANQLPCALRVYWPVDSHTCQTPWSVFQDGPNGEPAGRCQEHADAEARREARAASHDRGNDVSAGITTARAWAAAAIRIGPRPESIGGPALAVPHPTGAHRRPPSASLPTISSTL
ncbi:hypothetical protein CMV_027125 [Castanea mollissima]|uniref:Uncharacterized protein n=1 Tax=Castanea mollissima TaxID=60419 RepID=A0A8J4VF94_9ROSI|nr:hypothetical protein CMV_027125 [Castanea mollissima]